MHTEHDNKINGGGDSAAREMLENEAKAIIKKLSDKQLTMLLERKELWT